MRLLSRPADRFQRALDGAPAADHQTAELLATTRPLVALRQRGPAPDPAFVAQLRERLMAEAATLPTPSKAAARAAASRRAEARTTPVVVVVGRGMPKLLAGALASALLVGGLVGIVSRSTLPGDALYPVKGWLDSVAVRLADNDLDRGRTQLAQAQEHISEARELAEGNGRDTGDINIALQAAIDSVQAGQRSLDAAWASTGNPQALLAQRDFTARALPQVEALRTEVPAGSQRLVGTLEALLHDTQAAAARRLGACGSACSGATSQSAPGSIGVPSTALTARVSEAARPSPRTTTGAGITVPGSPVTGQAAGGGTVPAPGASAGAAGGGVSVGGTGSGVTLSTSGATANLPTVSASLPGVPSASASLPLPSATIGTGGVTATQPPVGLGPVTVSLPGATLPLP